MMSAKKDPFGTHAMYYYRDGNPITGTREEQTLTWAKLMEDRKYAQIADDVINGLRISTVWLGLDHGFGVDDGVPIIFETMVFADDESYTEMDGRRYATEAEAFEGHQQILGSMQRGTWVPYETDPRYNEYEIDEELLT